MTYRVEHALNDFAEPKAVEEGQRVGTRTSLIGTRITGGPWAELVQPQVVPRA